MRFVDTLYVVVWSSRGR